MRVFELKVPPVALAVAFAVVMWAASTSWSAVSFPLPGALIVAFLFGFVGGGIAAAGVFAFR